MTHISTKATAEAILRELPSVLGAYVNEDMEGRPREVHLLVRQGPDAARLARDIHDLLEERLGVPIDQRVISIAQLARDPDWADAETPDVPEVPGDAVVVPDGRPVFIGLESSVSAGHVTVGVRLEWRGDVAEGSADSVDTTQGRARAAATATLRAAADAVGGGELSLELDFASIVQALDGEYVLVSVLGMSRRIGRRPLPLVGAQPIESDVESAATLAALKAINRILTLALQTA